MELVLLLVAAVAIVGVGVSVVVALERRRPGSLKRGTVPALVTAALLTVAGMIIAQSWMVWLAGGAVLASIYLWLQSGERRSKG